MFVKFIAFCAAIAVLAVSSVSAADPMWQDMFVFDCARSVHFMPTNNLVSSGMFGGGLKYDVLIEGAFSLIREKAKCHCSSLSEAELDESFTMNWANVLRVFAGDDEPDFGQCEFDFAIDYLSEVANVAFPETCSYLDYLQGEPCTFALDLGDVLDVELQFTFATCSGNSPLGVSLPYFSVTCGGDLCEDLGRPCATNADCEGGDECFPLGDDFTSGMADVFSEMADIMKVFPSDASTCTLGDLSISAGSVGTVLVDAFWDAILMILDIEDGGSGYGVCGVNRFQDAAGDWDFEGIFEDIPANIFGEDEFGNMEVYLQAWDGVLQSGEDSASDDRMDGSAFPATSVDLPATAGEVVMMHRSCDNIMAMNPNGAVSLQGRLPDINGHYEGFYGMMAGLLDCRSDGVATEEDLEYQFNMMDLGFWLDILEADSPRVWPLARTFNYTFPDNLRNMMLSEMDSNRVDLPASCDATSWAENKRCDIEYDYLSGLFSGEDISMRVSIEECPLSPHAAPKITMTCVGDICQDLMEPYLVDVCNQDSDCNDGRSCTVLEDDEVKDIFSELLYGANTNPGYDSLVSWIIYDNVQNETAHLLQQGYEADYSYTQYVTEQIVPEMLARTELYGNDDNNKYGLYSGDYTVITDTSVDHWWTVEPLLVLVPPTQEHSGFTHGNIYGMITDEVYAYVDYVEEGDAYPPCADGTFTEGCEVDECSDIRTFHWELFNLLMSATDQDTVTTDNSNYVGICQTQWEVSLDTTNIDVWSEDVIKTDDATKITTVTGLVEVEVDVCDTCSGTCLEGYCYNDATGDASTVEESVVTSTVAISNIDYSAVTSTFEDAVLADLATSLGVDISTIHVTDVVETATGVDVEFEVVLADPAAAAELVEVIAEDSVQLDEVNTLGDELFLDPDTDAGAELQQATVDDTDDDTEPYTLPAASVAPALAASVVVVAAAFFN